MELSSFPTDTKQQQGDSDAHEMLVSSLHIYFEKLADEFNRTVAEEPLMVTARLLETDEQANSKGVKEARMLVTTSLWALSLRVRSTIAEFFLLPATEVATLLKSELPSRLKLALELSGDRSLTMNGTPVTAEELNALMRGLFKDVVIKSKHDFENMPESMRLVSGSQSFVGSVRSLVAEKHALVQKIVNQQEAIQAQLSRELHDSILGNVMLLSRSLSGNKRMSDEEMKVLLDEIAARLREVCQELSPRDLKDCGLRPMLEELTRTVSHVGSDCQFTCPHSLPHFPDEVALHIYRIAQECFNNIVKHSRASEVKFEIGLVDRVFTMKISDNGQGFDAAAKSQRSGQGGSGTGIIKERTELINCVYPARVWIDSQPGTGTSVTLEIAVIS